MHELVFFDGKLIPAAAASLSALSAAALYGRGMFTTVAVFEGEPFLWEKHLKRLSVGCAGLGIEFPQPDGRDIKQLLDELIKINQVTSGRARITVFDGGASELWPAALPKGPMILIMTADTRANPSPFRVTVARYQLNSRSPLAGIKSLNYTDKLLTLAEARTAGFNECIQLNEREEVTSAAMANIFWLSKGVLFTPELTTGCLAGTTREHIVDRLSVEEVSVGIDVLRGAEQIFLTSAGLGVVAIDEFDGLRKSTSHSPILDLFPRS